MDELQLYKKLILKTLNFVSHTSTQAQRGYQNKRANLKGGQSLNPGKLKILTEVTIIKTIPN